MIRGVRQLLPLQKQLHKSRHHLLILAVRCGHQLIGKSLETKAYPDLSKVKHLWIKVNLRTNRTYLYDGNHVIYTMYSTGGIYKKVPKTGKMKSMTPTGTFYVQQERGNSFYNARLKEAAKLGKSTGSHGCIRLSVADAKWMEENLPVGTKVEIVG